MDIHNKPGFDPKRELFFDPVKKCIAQDAQFGQGIAWPDQRFRQLARDPQRCCVLGENLKATDIAGIFGEVVDPLMTGRPYGRFNRKTSPSTAGRKITRRAAVGRSRSFRSAAGGLFSAAGLDFQRPGARLCS